MRGCQVAGRVSGSERKAGANQMNMGGNRMVKLCVFYYGKPEDPEAFDKYYWTHHLSIVARWPHIQRIVISKGQPGDDIYQMAELFFDNRVDMETALRSPERALAAEDVKNFPRFNGELKRQTFEVNEYGRN
jgi:uncharacterized protein (TIGR02118 family)